MKPLRRLLLRLYPRWWRARYGDEFDALLEESRSGWRSTLDVIKGAFVMRMRGFVTLPLAVALVGAMFGMLRLHLAPALYASSSIVRVTGVDFEHIESDSSKRFRDTVSQAVPSREDRGRTNIMILESRPDSAVVKISHSARNASEAQRFVERVVASVVGEGTADGGRGTVVEAPNLPARASRAGGVAPVLFGATAGLLLGVVISVAGRATRKARGRHGTDV